ncbi:MAG TPA: feruloyl-CoA synthase [Pusillimonas sp.]|uniref:feruloyl-CoA synthase n=1 Tax=Pusillimonas sp. TaxID=3040095 RepID=UPI002CA5BDB6|nr:feruloyl-CoA synthase [Pusillimonas sp.]HUH87071.1 feruloyl-CoA synthase [Pusillimonas sp.]
METTPRYRSVALGPKDIDIQTRDNGFTYVRSSGQLGDYPARLTDKLIYWAKQAPDRTYIAQREPDHGPWRRISYAQALQAARRIGQALLERGLGVERPVLILSGNDIEQALLALGCQFAGIPYSPISPAYSLVSKDYEKLRHVLEVITPGLVFAADAQLYSDAINATISPDIELVATRPGNINRPCTSFEQLFAEPTAAIDTAQQATGPDTIVKFLFTSGSTSLPKAVINTQRMMCSNLKMMVLAWPFLTEEPPVLVDWLPWNHTFGGNHNLGMVLYNGGTLYIDEGKPTDQGMQTTLRNLREIAPTVYFNVPIGWEKIANALESDPELRSKFYSRIKMQFYSGAALAQPVWDKLHATAELECGERIVMTTGLGMTETSPSAMFVLDERALAGQIGHPLPGMEFKLVPNADKTEVRYKGPNVTPGYWREPEKTAEAFDDEGFFCSGDAVKWLDPHDPNQGFVFDGRVAEDFKLDTGTWVNVGPLRALVARQGAPYLQDSVITGHNRRELGVLIVPNLAQCRKLSGLPESATDQEALASPAVRNFFQQLIQRLNSLGTGSATRITRGLVLTQPPSLDLGEITDKGSINQRAVLTHRAALVDALYNETDAGVIKADTQSSHT